MTAKTKNTEAKKESDEQGGPKIIWDTSGLRSSYANICQVNSTRDEVVLTFGMNQGWERAGGDLSVELTHRIVLSPFASKRLNRTLAQMIEQYEARYGELHVD